MQPKARLVTPKSSLDSYVLSEGDLSWWPHEIDHTEWAQISLPLLLKVPPLGWSCVVLSYKWPLCEPQDTQTSLVFDLSGPLREWEWTGVWEHLGFHKTVEQYCQCNTDSGPDPASL